MAEIKTTLTIEVEGLSELKKLSKIDEIILVHWEFSQFLRNYGKHVDMSKPQYKTYKEICDGYFSLLSDRNVNIDELTE